VADLLLHCFDGLCLYLKAVFKGQDLKDFALLAVGTLFQTMGYKIILNNKNGKNSKSPVFP
jgi:hypothetical protein